MATTRTRSGLALFACAIAFLLPVAFSPSVHAVFWAPKAALIPLVAAVGLPRLFLLARSPSPARAPARAALVFLGVATLSTLLADNQTTAVFGLYIWGTGLIFVIALAGAWSIGVSLDESGRGDVTKALLGGVLVNVAFALFEMVGDLSSFELARYDGRSIGLMGNPVHLGAIAAAGLALVLPWRGRRLWPWLALTAAVAAAVEVSGSRAALIALIAVVVATARIRHSNLGIRRILAVIVVVLLGVGGGALLTNRGGGVSVTGRVTAADGGGGVTPRLSMWWATRHAVADHPLVGSGPGTYREATSGYRTVAVARGFGPDRYFADAHNLVVEYVTTTGLLGLSTGLAWLGLASRRTKGPLRLFAAGILLVGLAEPQSPGTTPLAMVALGAAGPLLTKGTPDPAGAKSRSLGWLTGGLALVAVIASVVFLVGSFHLDQAVLDFDRRHADRSLALLPRWPLPATIRARIETFEGRSQRDAAKLGLAERWQRQAISRDPTDPNLWLILADATAARGHRIDAESAYAEVLKLNPVSTQARNGLAEQAILSGRLREARRWLRRSLSIDPSQTRVRRLLGQVEERLSASEQ